MNCDACIFYDHEEHKCKLHLNWGIVLDEDDCPDWQN